MNLTLYFFLNIILSVALGDREDSLGDEYINENRSKFNAPASRDLGFY